LRLNADDTIDIGGPDMTTTRRYRNMLANPAVSFVVDDMTPDAPGAVRPGMGRGVEIRGRAQPLAVETPPVNPTWFSKDIIRIHPRRVISWHIDATNPDGEARDITARAVPGRAGRADTPTTSCAPADPAHTGSGCSNHHNTGEGDNNHGR
jgi:pyridoxamine 5'-phosphate oxidase family protein